MTKPPLYYCSICGTLMQPTPLTAREVEVLQAYAAGKKARQIAQELFISTSTVESHRSSILLKLGMKTIVEAAIYAVKRGIIQC